VQGSENEVGAALDALSDAHPGAVVGIGRAVPAIGDAHHSLRDAQLAVVR
jgi:hypothetical protein